jgi:hypothetical protein
MKAVYFYFDCEDSASHTLKTNPTPTNASDARVCAVKDKIDTLSRVIFQPKKERRTLRPESSSTVELDLGSYPTLAAPVDVDMLPVAAAVPDTAVPETDVPVRAAVDVGDVVGSAVMLDVVVSVGGSAASAFWMLTSTQL